MQVQGGQQLVVGPLDFSGFQTPNSGNVDAHVTVWATEGDRGITGDYLSLGNQNALCGPLTKQHDAAHPVDNFFNSTISSGGVDVGGRTPSYSNQLGFDLATLNVPEGTIGNNQTRRLGVPGHDRRHLLLRRLGVRHADQGPQPRHLKSGRSHHG